MVGNEGTDSGGQGHTGEAPSQQGPSSAPAVSLTSVWTYQTEAAGTRVTLSVDYSIPGAAAGLLAESIVQKMNENEADIIAANLKARMEAWPEPGEAAGRRFDVF